MAIPTSYNTSRFIATFEKQKKYIWKPGPAFPETASNQEEQTTVVYFLGYTPCSAIIGVEDEYGRPYRIKRDELFEIKIKSSPTSDRSSYYGKEGAPCETEKK